MTPHITLVSGTFDRLEYLREMITSARAAIPRGIVMDFVIVDGGSTDGTLDWLAEQPDIAVIKHGELRGAIAAFTDGAHAATGKYVLLANDDVLFKPESILKALIYLEENPGAGAVAFADNRKDKNKFQVDESYARKNGRGVMVPYAQVGLFRRWLGDRLNWWRGDNPIFAEARTYGGDNMLSSNIWHAGYSVDAVPGCEVIDLVANDGLRQHNINGQTDSQAYYDSWVDGPEITNQPAYPQEDNRQLRILYLPIYDPGHHERHIQTKRGLRDALSKRALVYELDYHQHDTRALISLLTSNGGILDTFQPHMLLMQCHGLGIITPELLRTIRNHRPQMVVYNWNGDVYPSGLTSPDALSLMPYIDLQMTVNQRAVEDLQRAGYNAVYWQIGYEEPGEDLPDVPAHDIVYLANAYEKTRIAFGRWLRQTYGDRVGIYGYGWPQDVKPDGECLYEFARGKALYRKAKIAIGTNEFPEQTGFVSNRIFQVLAANGAVLLQQEVKGLEELTGLKSGLYYFDWTTREELAGLIDDWDKWSSKAASAMAQAAYDLVRDHHSFDARVTELFRDLIPLARRKPTTIAALRYTGRRDTPFGEKGPATGFRYSVTPGESLYIDPRDKDALLKLGYFEVVDTYTLEVNL